MSPFLFVRKMVIKNARNILSHHLNDIFQKKSYIARLLLKEVFQCKTSGCLAIGDINKCKCEFRFVEQGFAKNRVNMNEKDTLI